MTQGLCESLNRLVADVFVLYIKTKNHHWHLTGPHFRDLHLLFDEQAGQILEMVDVLAERVRKLGSPTIGSMGQMLKLASLGEEYEVMLSSAERVKRLLADNEALAMSLKKVHAIAAQAGDHATTSILEIYLDETERRIWFLRSIGL